MPVFQRVNVRNIILCEQLVNKTVYLFAQCTVFRQLFGRIHRKGSFVWFRQKCRERYVKLGMVRFVCQDLRGIKGEEVDF